MNYVIICLVVFGLMALDIITGFANAVAKEQVSSSVMREGLFHKFGSIVIVLLGIIVQCFGQFIGIDQIVSTTAGTGIAAMVGIMELVSVLENCSRLNPELPMAKIFAAMGIDEFRQQ